jgi:hypothetical protein
MIVETKRGLFVMVMYVNRGNNKKFMFLSRKAVVTDKFKLLKDAHKHVWWDAGQTELGDRQKDDDASASIQAIPSSQSPQPLQQETTTVILHEGCLTASALHVRYNEASSSS